MRGRRWSGAYLSLTRIRGVELRVHWSLLALGVLMTVATYGVAFVTYAALILAHELGHATLAQRSGLVATRIDLHMFGGRCLMHMQWATPWNRGVVAWGGILVQLPLLIGAWLIVRFVPLPEGDIGRYLGQVFVILLPLNFGMIFFNALPVAPLDGYEGWRIVPMIPGRLRVWRYERKARAQRASQKRDLRRSVTAQRAKARGLRVVRPSDDELH